MSEYTDFVKEQKKKNPQISFREIGVLWAEVRKKAGTGVSTTKKAVTSDLSPKELPEKVLSDEGERFSLDVDAQEPLKVASSSESAEKVSDTIKNNSSAPCDDVELKSYKLVIGSIHRSIKGMISALTDGKVKISDEDMNDLNEAGAEVVKKYDVKGWIKEHFPTIAYVFTLISVIMKTSFQYIKWKKEQHATEEAVPSAEDERKIPPIDNPKSRSA